MDLEKGVVLLTISLCSITNILLLNANLNDGIELIAMGAAFYIVCISVVKGANAILD